MGKDFQDFLDWMGTNDDYLNARRTTEERMAKDYEDGKLNKLEFVMAWADATAQLQLNAYHKWLHG